MEQTTAALQNSQAEDPGLKPPQKNNNDVSDSRIFGASSEDSDSDKGEGSGNGTGTATEAQGKNFF